jgi:hypothetical protein
MNAATIQAYRRSLAFEDLFHLRLHCAKFLYELQLHSARGDWSELGELYSHLLTTATRFRYPASAALIDVDPNFYVVRYLRAWQLHALLRDTLVQKFDDEWWSNTQAGQWICEELFSHGQRELADEQARRVSGRDLSFDPLRVALETRLA